MNSQFELVQRVEFIKRACAGNRVLHLGCTNWPYTEDAISKNMLLHLELEKISESIYGFDFDQHGLDMLQSAGSSNLYQADLERLEEVPLDEKFDVIIAGEIIEHLSNPGRFLSGIQRFMDCKTTLVITTVNAYCALRFAQYGLRGRRGEKEPVHPDHVGYYSFRTLTLLLERHGLRTDAFHFYDVGVEHRPYLPWYYRLVNDVSVKLFPHLSDGVIAVASLKPTQ